MDENSAISLGSSSKLCSISGSILSKSVNLDEYRGKFNDFRCEWQESDLYGNVKAFGLTIRLYASKETLVRIDGAHAAWAATTVTTKYGVADKYDFFVGGKVSVYGRTLTIMSCPFEVCREIECMGDALRTRQIWLQTKIQSVLAVPVVLSKGLEVQAIDFRHTRSGRSNLRKLFLDNNKLVEQLYGLGMGHLMR